MAKARDPRGVAVGGPDGLAALARQVAVCRACGLCELRTNAVPGEGSGRSGLMVVGEAPGRTEDETGRPFAGAAGRNLDLAFAAAGLRREDVFVTSIVKCRPPENRDPTPQEKDACRPFLMRQVETLRPRVLAALGRHGLHGLLGKLPQDFVSLRGTFVEGGPGGVPVFVSLHPAAVIYRQKWKETYLEDWRRFGAWLRSGKPVSAYEPAPWVDPASSRPAVPQA